MKNSKKAEREFREAIIARTEEEVQKQYPGLRGKVDTGSVDKFIRESPKDIDKA